MDRRGYNFSREVEEKAVPDAAKFLRSQGFARVERTDPGPTEFRAYHGDRRAYIELKVRSDEAPDQKFSLRLSKLRTLERLSLQGEVFLLLRNKAGFRVLPFDEIPNDPDVRVFSAGKPRYWIAVSYGSDLDDMLRELCDITGQERTKVTDEMIRFTWSEREGFRKFHEARKPQTARPDVAMR